MQVHLPSEGLPDVSCLSRVFGNRTASYKFYWFISIVDWVCRCPDRMRFSFAEIVAGMLSEAWYPVHYFRLSFGKSDKLQTHILEIQQLLNIPIKANKQDVREAVLNNIEMAEVRKMIDQLTQNVPYWFLSPWIPGETQVSAVERKSRINYNWCPYAIFGKEIEVDPVWTQYILRNAVILRDFAFWNLTEFLQTRNPNVPDIPSKLVKPIGRHSLPKQHHYWDYYLEERGGMPCIYTGKILKPGQYDLDHFIPWSFVVHDMLWNLLPADPSINSSKSDNIPPLERFLGPMAAAQQNALRLNFKRNASDKLLEDYLVFRCSIEELVDAPAETFLELYKNEFTPMAQTAINMGFSPWINA